MRQVDIDIFNKNNNFINYLKLFVNIIISILKILELLMVFFSFNCCIF